MFYDVHQLPVRSRVSVRLWVCAGRVAEDVAECCPVRVPSSSVYGRRHGDTLVTGQELKENGPFTCRVCRYFVKFWCLLDQLLRPLVLPLL